MDSLVIVTVLSLAMAAILSIVVWRVLRQERRRGDARVAALSQMAAAAEPSPRPVERQGYKPRITVAPLAPPPPVNTATEPLDLPLNAPAAPSASRVIPSRTSGHGTPATPVAVAPMFAAREPATPAWGYRLLVMAALALAGASVVLIALTSQARSSSEHGVQPRGTATASSAAAALELLSLRDAREGDALTITGVVRNPRGSAALNRVTVTALTFDATGAYVATGRALIDVTALTPGDESPFVVTVPSAAKVARYRIAFRAEDGRVIAHTDRRQSTPVADVTTAARADKVTP